MQSKQVTWFGKSHFGSPFEIYTIPREDSNELTVKVGTYQDTDQLTETEITNIPIRRNSITTCRGAIFNGKVSKVQIVINPISDEWGTPIDYEIPIN